MEVQKRVNFLKGSAVVTVGIAALSNQDWLFIISIILTVAGMLQDYLATRDLRRLVK